jgi:hypothetical protein
LAKRMGEMGLYKTATGYWKREDLDRMMGGGGAGRAGASL